MCRCEKQICLLLLILVASLWVGCTRNYCLAGAGDYSLLQSIQTWLWGPPNSCSVVMRGTSPGVKLPECQPYFSPFFFFLLWCCNPTRVLASSFLRFLDHTQRCTTVGRTPLDKLSAHSRDLYLTTHNTLSPSHSNDATAQDRTRPPLRVSSILPVLVRLLSSFYNLASLHLPPLHLPNAVWVCLWGVFLLAHREELSWIDHHHPGVKQDC